jgi:2-polyprenyl-6-methoxyphenol hydroxylase-like FAD-dependent oxidoreductase
MQHRALVSGASIAGTTVAHRLADAGWSVTVVERAPSFRSGGQNVDVRGAAREVLRRMHLDDAVLARGTGELGTRFVRADGSTVAAFPAATDDTSGATAEAEILRGELATLIRDATDEVANASGGGSVDWRYGERITAIDDGPTRARVSFEHGADEDFDVVVVAEGLRSATRRMVFGGSVLLRPLRLSTTFGTIPKAETDDDWWRWYNAPGGRSISVRPDRHGTTRALLAARTDRRAYPPAPMDDEQQIAALRQRFGDAGWEVPRILDGLAASDDVYSVDIAQVRAPQWSRGRVVLVGDAAHCPSPVSGMGTSLALVGAYVFGDALTRRDERHEDLADAFARYDRALRPYAERAQQLPPGTPEAANPMSALGVAAFRAVLRFGASPLGSAFRRRFMRPSADDYALPDERTKTTAV